jgi:exodeoxyribonuclease VII large subunit
MVLESNDHNVYTVTEITGRIKRVLETSFRLVNVEGEISNCVHYASGHMYFSLKDSAAQLRCVMFRNSNRNLAFKPENGSLVKVTGSVSVYSPRGDYQLIVKAMRPAGMGELHLAFERLKQMLQREGLFDTKWKKPVPVFPETIGVVTSPNGAAISDIVNVISRRYPIVDLVLCPARVQGNTAAGEIVRAIQTFDTLPEDKKPDTLIVGRGGGSIEDLWPFNEQIVARAVFKCSIPIISAVGHETDFTICDFVADLRAPTPSAAAESAVPDIREIRSHLLVLKRRLEREESNSIKIRRLHLEKKIQHELFKPMERIREIQLTMDRICDQMNGAFKTGMYVTDTRLSQMRSRIASYRPDRKLLEYRAELKVINNRLVAAIKKHLHNVTFELSYKQTNLKKFNLTDFCKKIESITAALKGHDPRLILQKGYAICSINNKTIVSSVTKVSRHNQMQVELIDGFLDCDIDGIRRKRDG